MLARKTYWLLSFTLVGFVILWLAACGGSETSDQPTSTEVKLASLDAGEILTQADPRTQRIKLLLEKIGPRVKEPPDRIADITFVARDQFRKKGIDVTLVEILAMGEKAIPAEAAGAVSYAEVMAVLVTMSERK